MVLWTFMRESSIISQKSFGYLFLREGIGQLTIEIAKAPECQTFWGFFERNFMKPKFDWRKFLQELAMIAIPVALQNLLTTTGSMIDTMMIAPLGENAVEAVGLCAQFSSLLFSGYWGFVGGGMLFFAQYWGAGDHKGINRAYGTTMAFLMIVSCTGGILAMVKPELIMHIYTDKAAIQKIGTEYLSMVGGAYIFSTLATGMSALLRSTERVKIPLVAAIASVSTNVFLNWVFIYGHLGSKPMGVKGAALATTCAGLVNMTMVFLLAKLRGYRYLSQFRDHFRWSVPWMKEYLHKCFPIICNELLIGIGNMVINIVLGRQSEQAIAAMAVFRTLEGLIIGFFAGFSNAASILVGKCVGAGELDTAYERAKRLVLTCGSTIACICGLVFALHKPILTAMSLSGTSYQIGVQILGIYCVAAIIRMCNWIQNDTYRSAGDAAYGTILEITFMWLMIIPAVCLAGLVWKLPFWMIFVCCYIDEPIRFCLMQYHMYTGRWIKPVTEQGRLALADFQKNRKNLRRESRDQKK